MTETVDRRQNLKPHKADFWYRNTSENSHTKKYRNTLKRMGDRWNDCENVNDVPGTDSLQTVGFSTCRLAILFKLMIVMMTT
jgi:hypothetical protein